MSSKIAQNRIEGKVFSEDDLKLLLRHVALVIYNYTCVGGLGEVQCHVVGVVGCHQSMDCN